ncbi:MAG TPA: AAA family ATPase [Nocardioides sp.]|uniref:AAA family ATPase n=1 Tax=Nocardioides sp. TaxID=35761 RepID=UPI002C0A0A5B|nr:AAA family ATPase [Nocardioides sp.]HTW16165.1 AAA family ATPase [Nocardioides sp.]
MAVYEDQIAVAIDRLLRQHTGTNRRWLAIEGPSLLGKSSAITAVLLDRAMAHPQWRTQSPEGRQQTPYIYLASQTNQTSKAYLVAIARACGLPADGDEHRLHNRLSELLLAHGVELIVVDDGHFCRRISDQASRLSDGLRALLDLPVPIVVVGIDLSRSAWLRDPGRNNDSAQQLRRRANRLVLLPLHRDRGPKPADLFAALLRHLQRIEGFHAPGLNPETMFWLTTRLEGLTGSMLEAVKTAAVEAIWDNGRALTKDHLYAAVGDFA